MDQLLAVYKELVASATDDQIIVHLTNLIQDAAALADATKQIVDAARARTQPS